MELQAGQPHLSSRRMKDEKVIMGGQHGFVNGKLCLTNLIAGHFITEGSTDGGEAVDVVYLYFSKVFDSVSFNILIDN